MKKLLLYFAALALGASTLGAAVPQARIAHLGLDPDNRERATRMAKTKTLLRQAAGESIWRPATVTNYFWGEDYETSTFVWFDGGKTTCEYNDKGLVTRVDKGYDAYEYSYDELDRVTSVTIFGFDYELNGFTAVDKEEFTYDSVVKDLVVSSTSSHILDGKWEMSYAYRTDITRNADGNVVTIKTFSNDGQPGGNQWVEDGKMEVGYGQDKKANSIKLIDIEDGVEEIMAWMTDIKWVKTNGQIVNLDDEDGAFVSGDNIMSSSKALGKYTYPYAGDIYFTVQYRDNGYRRDAVMNNEPYMWEDYTSLDENGSYTKTSYEVDYDSTDDGSYVRDEASLEEETKIYDAFGLKLKEEEIYYIGDTKESGIDYQSLTTGTVTYDPAHGYPLEYIKASSYDGGELVNNEKTVYGDYYVVNSGIEGVEAGNNAPAEYFTLQGVRVTNPGKGVYIRRQGSDVKKVIVR